MRGLSTACHRPLAQAAGARRASNGPSSSRQQWSPIIFLLGIDRARPFASLPRSPPSIRSQRRTVLRSTTNSRAICRELSPRSRRATISRTRSAPSARPPLPLLSAEKLLLPCALPCSPPPGSGRGVSNDNYWGEIQMIADTQGAPRATWDRPRLYLARWCASARSPRTTQ